MMHKLRDAMHVMFLGTSQITTVKMLFELMMSWVRARYVQCLQGCYACKHMMSVHIYTAAQGKVTP